MLSKKHTDPNTTIKLARDGRTVIKAKKRQTHKQISKNMNDASVAKGIRSGRLVIPDDCDDVENFIKTEMLKKLMNLKVTEPPEEKNEYVLENEESESDCTETAESSESEESEESEESDCTESSEESEVDL